MSALSSMDLAVDQATRQRDQQRLELARTLQAQDAAQDQFNQLESYAQETQTRWISKSQQQATPEVMRHYYQFMDKLHQAMALQTQALQEAGRRVQEQQECLLQAEFKLAGRQTVCANMRREAGLRRDKLEQKQFDEMAAQQYRRNRAQHAI